MRWEAKTANLFNSDDDDVCVFFYLQNTGPNVCVDVQLENEGKVRQMDTRRCLSAAAGLSKHPGPQIVQCKMERIARVWKSKVIEMEFLELMLRGPLCFNVGLK